MDVRQSARYVSRALREPRTFAIAVATAASLLTSLLVGAAWTWQNESARSAQIEEIGRSTVGQLASLSVEPLIALDRMRLAVLVTRLAELSTIRLASVLTLDDRVVALAGDESLAGATVYLEPITFEGEVAGYARVLVEDAAVGRSLDPGLPVWLVIALSAVGAALAAHFLQSWLFAEEPEAPDADDADAVEAPARDVEFLLVVNLFNQNLVPQPQRSEVLREARLRIERLSTASRARVLDLPGTGWIVRIPVVTSNNDHAFDAFCVALAIAEALDELNAEPSRPRGIELRFRLGLHIASPLDSDETLRQSDALHDALVLSAVAPDGSVAASEEAFERLLRPERLVVDELANAVLASLTTARRDGCVVVSTTADAYRPALERLLASVEGITGG